MSHSAVATPSEFTLCVRQTPLYRRVDVLVCGGGFAGVAAAVAAARAGADTLLVERNVVLGGNGPLSFELALGTAGAGISAEILSKLVADGHAEPDAVADGCLVGDPEWIKYACLDLVRGAGVSLLLSSWVSDPIVEDGVVRGAMVENKSGRFAISAGMVVDATGDAGLALRADATVIEPVDTHLRINARIGGIDVERALAGRTDWPTLIAAAKQAGELDPAQPDTIALYGITPTAIQRGMAFVAGASFANQRGWDTNDLSNSEILGRKLMRAFITFLKSVPGFEESFVVDVAGTVAIDGSRQVPCDNVLTCEDAAALLMRGIEPDRCAEGRDADIPPGILAPHGVGGLLVAGRAGCFAPGDAQIDSMAIGEIAGRIAASRVIASRPTASAA